MKKALFYIIITICFLLLTFFGLGPVVFADGSMTERLITLAIVLTLYLLLFAILAWFKKRNKK